MILFFDNDRIPRRLDTILDAAVGGGSMLPPPDDQKIDQLTQLATEIEILRVALQNLGVKPTPLSQERMEQYEFVVVEEDGCIAMAGLQDLAPDNAAAKTDARELLGRLMTRCKKRK